MLMVILLACGSPVGDESSGGASMEAHVGEPCGSGEDYEPYGGEYNEYGDCVKLDGTGDFASCDQAVLAFGYVNLWQRAEDQDSGDVDILTLDYDFEMTRPWLAVAWEIEEDPGYAITCSDYESADVPKNPEDVPYEEWDTLPSYWVVQFDFNGLYIFDPEEDPGSYQTLPLEAHGPGGAYFVKSELNLYEPDTE